MWAGLHPEALGTSLHSAARPWSRAGGRILPGTLAQAGVPSATRVSPLPSMFYAFHPGFLITSCFIVFGNKYKFYEENIYGWSQWNLHMKSAGVGGESIYLSAYLPSGGIYNCTRICTYLPMSRPQSHP